MKFRRQRREEVGINLTPLIDVVFLLLIFFMVSTTFNRETQLSIDLPEAQGKAVEVSDQKIEILIDQSGAAGHEDAQAAHEDVVRAMDAAGQMGFVHLSITTRQPSEGRESPRQ